MNHLHNSVPILNRSPLVCFAIILTLFGILPTSNLSAESRKLKSWSEFKKVPKPQHEGIQEKLKNSHVYLNAQSFSLRIPVGSLLHVPPRLASRVTPQPEFKLVSWQHFLSANHNWLRPCPISWDQVTGKAALPKSLTENLADSPYLNIATFRQSPITVTAPKIVVEEPIALNSVPQ